MYSSMSLTQRKYVCHLLKAEIQTEVESHLLKSTMKVESNHLWILVNKQWCLLSGPVRISWSQRQPLVQLCQSFLLSIPFLPCVMLSVLFNKYRLKRQTHIETQSDTIHTHKDTDSTHRHIQQTNTETHSPHTTDTQA